MIEKPLELLIIDDDPSIRTLFETLVNLSQFKADSASNGQEGIDNYLTRLNDGNPYSAVLTDLNMPIKSGVDVVRTVRDRTPNVPIYILTANEANSTYQNLKKELSELAPDDVIQKPMEFNKFMQFLNNLHTYLITSKLNEGNSAPKYQS